MNLTELAQRLADEGCHPDNYAIGPIWAVSDIHRLHHSQGQWRVCYTERGLDAEPMFSSESEHDACEFYLRFITETIRHEHLVARLQSPVRVAALQAQLREFGVETRLERVNRGHDIDPEFRVWVVGKAVFVCREQLGALHLTE
jgi:hypothetical protein